MKKSINNDKEKNSVNDSDHFMFATTGNQEANVFANGFNSNNEENEKDKKNDATNTNTGWTDTSDAAGIGANMATNMAILNQNNNAGANNTNIPDVANLDTHIVSDIQNVQGSNGFNLIDLLVDFFGQCFGAAQKGDIENTTNWTSGNVPLAGNYNRNDDYDDGVVDCDGCCF